MSETTIDGLPPSAKLIYKVLEYDGPLTQKGIAEESRLSQRTVRDAIARLESRSIVTRRVYVPDARQNLYELTSIDDDGIDEGALLSNPPSLD